MQLADVHRVLSDGTPAFSVYSRKTWPQVYGLDGRLLAEYPPGDMVATTYLTDRAVRYVFDNPCGKEVEIAFSAVEGTIGIFQPQVPQPFGAVMSIGPFSPAAVVQLQAAVASNGEVRVRRSGKRFDVTLPLAAGAPIAPTTVIQIAQVPSDTPSPVAVGKTEHKPVTLVAIGDSVTAGMQSSTLVETHQPEGYAPLLARQIARAVPMEPPVFPLPLIGVPGVPTPTFDLPNSSYPAPAGIRQGFRKNRDVAAHNLAVPEFTIKEVLTQTLYAPHFDKHREVAGPCSREVLIGPIFEEFRRNQNAANIYQVDAPQVAQADALKPSVIAVWAGNNDSIATLFFPSRIEGRLTDPDAFDSRLNAILKQVRAPGRGIVLFDLPDLTRTPFMKPLGEEIKPLGFTIDVSRLEIPALFQGIVNQSISKMKLPRFVASKLNRSPTREEFARGSAVPLTILGEHLEGLFRLA